MLKPLRVMKNDVAEGFRGRILHPVKALIEGSTRLAVHKYAHMLAALCASQLTTSGGYVSAPIARDAVRPIGEAIFPVRGPNKGQGRPPVHNFPCNHNTLYKTREAFAYLGLSSYETPNPQVEVMTRHAFGLFGLHKGDEALDADTLLADIKYPTYPSGAVWELARQEVLRVATLGSRSCHRRSYVTPGWLLSRLAVLDEVHRPNNYVSDSLAEALCVSREVFWPHVDELFCKGLLMAYQGRFSTWFRLTDSGKALLRVDEPRHLWGKDEISPDAVTREYFTRCITTRDGDLPAIDRAIAGMPYERVLISLQSIPHEHLLVAPVSRSTGFKAFKERKALLDVLQPKR